ncbi:terminase large subunit [Stenotrophomonas phage Philippe]|uniref:Terminase large subunit n=1 Tax=Stenotrophomonas phage Philippe TaxID=2859655 RepID=A0AAE8BI51_9CAUD|nr:terminase large subunit [Stenotrophomonas phage Philippe]QYW02289.1 terminase large subunit [Stenotrophomonas phage Philippe]
MSEEKKIKGRPVEAHLADVDYSFLNSTSYVPTSFALSFMNFIKLVNGAQGEANKTPPVHLAMLDKLALSTNSYLVNLLFRGAAKTTVFMEYMVLYLAVFGELPNHGIVEAMIYVSDSMENGVKNARKNIEHRYESSEFLKHWIPEAEFTDPYLEFKNRNGHKLGVKMYGARTGIRGSKIFGKRPTFCVLDDLIGDKDSGSKASMDAIKNTVYNGVLPAMDPGRRKVVFNGTPFNKQDVIIEAVESGEWDVNVYPVCERFPVSREEFRGAWEDRFQYDHLMRDYRLAVGTGKISGFMQEMMLQITSDEDRLIQDHDIRWYKRDALLDRRGNFNFYITTDFATSAKQTADFSCISVWAYNANGDWFFVDGIAKRQGMDKNINELFRLIAEYSPMSVGIEVSGQQGGFIPWLQEQQLERNVWFNFASSAKSGEPGIRPEADKMTRLQRVVPWFKAGKVYYPEEMKASEVVAVHMEQIRLATHSGIKGKDDALDTISQLLYLKPFKPSAGPGTRAEDPDMWEDDVAPPPSRLSSYIT